MPGYGLLDAERGQGLLPWSWATERLSQGRTYWLSTTRPGPDYRPHAMPIWGVWLNSAFGFTTGEWSRKARNLAARPDCVAGVTLEEESVIVEGMVRLEADAELRQAFAATYSEKYNWPRDNLSDAIYVVWPVTAYGFSAAADAFTGSATRWTFATMDRDRRP
jgi:nitroimidazol reductase NimA-like FMN-containing flavoprotein (pyridoxamine 5'-phosphate oxidase superfamily)